MVVKGLESGKEAANVSGRSLVYLESDIDSLGLKGGYCYFIENAYVHEGVKYYMLSVSVLQGLYVGVREDDLAITLVRPEWSGCTLV